VSYRPLVFVSGLTLGDYLLWNWSLNGNHEVVALVAGLTLPPLALATLWLLARAVARLLARGAGRQGARRSPAHRPARPQERRAPAPGRPAAEQPAARAAVTESSSRKLAA